MFFLLVSYFDSHLGILKIFQLFGILCLGNLEKEEELYTEEEKSDQIDLYIRWWQLNVFLPMLHFIKPPTTFPEDKVSAHNLA